jgi:hypothetical protein
MEEWKYSREEFLTLAPLKMVPYISAVMGYGGGYAPPWMLHEVGNLSASYATLKSLGYIEVSEKILDLLLDDMRGAFGLLSLFQELIVKPRNTLVRLCYNGTTNLDHEALMTVVEETKKQGIQVGKPLPATMPYEIGKFLVSKLSLLPEGYHSCVSLIDTYNQFDIQKLVRSIQEGVSSKNIDEMKSTSSELSNAFDTVWKEASKLTSRQREIKLAFTVSLGVIGGLATLSEFGIGGILASLGFQIAEQQFNEPLSKRLAIKTMPDYLVGIHNFKEKYEIPN